MRTHQTTRKLALSFAIILFTGILSIASTSLKKDKVQDLNNYTTYKGKVIDSESLSPLVFATVGIEGTNIATVTNVAGIFSIKVPKENENSTLKISFIGYETLTQSIQELKEGKQNTLKMILVAVQLSEVNVFPNNPRLIIDKVMRLRGENYMSNPVLMTGFYRETIKKRKSFVGLSEAVVQVYKQPYTNYKTDQIKLFKGRKSTNSKKLDTLLFKLQGGPHATLSLDIVKDPYMILDEDVLDLYEYSIVNITRIDGKLNYVIEFKQRPHVKEPLFFGKIYIDVDKFAISSISFNLNTENRAEASAMFIKKKPFGVNVYPTSANYIVNYREQDGKWQFNYSRGEVVFKVNWKKKLLSTTYTTMVEMAITDWKPAEDKPFKASNILKMNVVMSEAISGFSDTDFWGEYNIIEPEKSIEVAIRKIKKKLLKGNK